MKIGIILGIILGVILLIIAGITFLLTKKRGEKCKWCPWLALAGMCALITAAANTLYVF